jgi:hypothetical protein
MDSTDLLLIGGGVLVLLIIVKMRSKPKVAAVAPKAATGGLLGIATGALGGLVSTGVSIGKAAASTGEGYLENITGYNPNMQKAKTAAKTALVTNAEATLKAAMAAKSTTPTLGASSATPKATT